MSTDIIKTTVALPEPESDDNAERVRHWFGLVQEHGKATLEAAANLGEVLIEQRDLCRLETKRGGSSFNQWCEDNLPFSRNSADRYIKLAENWDKLSHAWESLGDISINQALRLIDETKVDRPIGEVVSEERPECEIPDGSIVAVQKVDPASGEVLWDSRDGVKYADHGKGVRASNPSQGAIVVPEERNGDRNINPLPEPIEGGDDAPEIVVFQPLDIATGDTPQDGQGDSPIAAPYVTHNSGNNEWYTPAEIIESARRVMGGIDLDPASHPDANEVVRALRFCTKNDCGLKQKWSGRVWLNPPYSQPLINEFSKKALHSVKHNHVEQMIVLVNSSTETEWFQRLFSFAAPYQTCFLRGRVKFWSPARDSHSPLQGQAIMYFGPSGLEFEEEFSKFGTVR